MPGPQAVPLKLNGTSFTAPSKAGLAPASPPVLLNGKNPTSSKMTLIKPSSTIQPPTGMAAYKNSSLQWTLETSIASGSWQQQTYLVALVFGMKRIDPKTGSSTSLPSAFDPSSIFTVPSTSALLPSSQPWADNTGIVSKSAFTYLVPPTGTFSLDVNWSQVNGTTLVESYSNTAVKYTKTVDGQPKEVPALVLALKYRAYFYTTTSGLWYVDPELDLCPGGG